MSSERKAKVCAVIAIVAAVLAIACQVASIILRASGQ